MSDAAMRAVRTIIQVVVAAGLTWLLSRVPAVAGMIEDRAAFEAAAVAAISGLVAWAWRRWLDPSSIPSLASDAAKGPADADT